MINLKDSGGTSTLTEAQVRAQVDAANVAYAAATAVALGNLNDLSPAQLNAALATTEANIRGGDNTIETIYDETEIIDTHLHSREHWCGNSGDQSGNNWGSDTLTAYRAISGNGVYGADADDEAKVIGSADTPIITGMVYFDIHRITVIAISSDTVYEIRTVWGTGTMAEAILADQFTEEMIITSTDKANKFGGAPFETQIPRLAVGTKVWLQVRNTTDNATMDFFIGIHEYDE